MNTGGAFPPPQGLPSAAVFVRIQWENARESIDLRWFPLRAFPLNPDKAGAALCAGPGGGGKAPHADSLWSDPCQSVKIRVQCFFASLFGPSALLNPAMDVLGFESHFRLHPQPVSRMEPSIFLMAEWLLRRYHQCEFCQHHWPDYGVFYWV